MNEMKKDTIIEWKSSPPGGLLCGPDAHGCGWAGWNHNEARFPTVLVVMPPDGYWDWLCPECVQERVSTDPEFAAMVLLASVGNNE